MPVTVGPYGQSQPSCFDRIKMGFMMGFAVGMAAGALFGTFSCLRIGMRGRELMGGVGKTMMQSGGTFGTFMAIDAQQQLRTAPPQLTGQQRTDNLGEFLKPVLSTLNYASEVYLHFHPLKTQTEGNI
uniref:Reactive oxygen species modulator 1 n=1 Tax=Zonotrichia albicollis TaxID=44394 RepID=A0A8D2N261_ZONAL|nr:reactive oxygen species modulator 1 isoform X1 [Zonotrichia albicollis]